MVRRGAAEEEPVCHKAETTDRLISGRDQDAARFSATVVRDDTAEAFAQSDTTAAIRYALSRWDALLRYSDDGRPEIDNNAAERALRAVALGRENYLFAGSDSDGERAAAIYSDRHDQAQRPRLRSLSP